MTRPVSLALLVALGLVGCSQSPPTRPRLTDQQREIARAAGDQLRTPSCGSFEKVDVKRIPKADFRALLADAQAARTEMGFDATPPGSATTIIRITEWGWGGAPDFYVVFPAADGRWTLRSGDTVPEGLEVVEKPLAADTAARLRALLSEQCLYAEPAYLPAILPYAEGGQGQCFDGSRTLMEVSFNGRTRTSYQVCNRGGFTMEIRNLLFRITHNP